MKKSAALCLVALTTASLGAAPAPELSGGERVLWIGNSLSGFFGPITECIQALLEASEPPIEDVHFYQMGKGMGIVKEYYTWSSLWCLDTIRNGNWDYIVLQTWEDVAYRKDAEWPEEGGDQLDYVGYPECQDTLVKYTGLFKEEAEKIGAQLLMYQPNVKAWAWVEQFEKSVEAHDRIVHELGVFNAPIIMAWDSVDQDYPSPQYECSDKGPEDEFIPMMFNDCTHQNGNGMALAAYTWYTIFTGKSAEGLNPVWPDNIRDGRYDEDKQDYFAAVAYAVGTRAISSGTVGTGPIVSSGILAREKADTHGRAFLLNGMQTGYSPVHANGLSLTKEGVKLFMGSSQSLSISGVRN